jgi:Cu+-exporting ATPase
MRLQRRLSGLEGVLDAQVSFHSMRAVVSVLDHQIDADRVKWIAQTEGCAVAELARDKVPEARYGIAEHSTLRRRALLVGVPAVGILLASFFTRDLAVGGPLVRGISTDTQLFVTALVLWFGRCLFTRGLSFTSWRQTSREAPFAIASLIGALYGLWAFFGHQEPYFEVPAALVAGYHIGRWLQSYFALRAQASLTDLRAAWPTEATVRRGEAHYCVAIDMLQHDDLVIIGRGDTVPADGLILETLSESVLVDESLVLGQGARTQKMTGDWVLSGTLVEDGAAIIRPEHWGRNSLLGRMLDVVSGATSTQAPSQRRGDRFAAFISPMCAVAAIATWFVWRQTWPDESLWTSLSPALAVLVALSPWALGWASEIPVLTGMTRAVRRGVLFRDASALEGARFLDVMMIEKAGTLTVGQPEVDSIELFGDVQLKDAARLLTAVEGKSDHAIAATIRTFASEIGASGSDVPEVRSFREIPGSGVIARIEDKEVVFGSLELVEGKGSTIDEDQRTAHALYLTVDSELWARLRMYDPIRDDGASMVSRLGDSGIRPMLITSSSEAEAERVATQVGLDLGDIRAGVDGANHAQAVRAVQAAGRRVGVVGQAIDDMAALQAADIAFALYHAAAPASSNSELPNEEFAVVSVRPGEGGVRVALDLSESASQRVQENFIIGSSLMVGALAAAIGWIGPTAAVAFVLIGLFLIGTNGLR